MKIVIIGAGFTGTQLAKRLINGKNDVVLIDNNEDVVRHASNSLDCEVLTADGNNLATLEEAGIDKADALVCVTSSDEVNMITCSLVDSVYPKLLKIARVRNYAYYTNTASAALKHTGNNSNTFRPLYGIDFMVHPDVEAAKAIVSSLEHGSVIDSIPFENTDFELSRVTVEKGSELEGKSLQDVRKLFDKPVIISYVESDGKTSLPDGATIINADDCLGVLMHHDDLQAFLKLCGLKKKSINKIMLVGAGRIGTIVAEKLVHKKSKIVNRFFSFKRKVAEEFVIIDTNAERAKAASENFKNARVFKADASDETFIHEEGLDNFDLVICATHNYSLNMVLAAFLESLGIENSICLVTTSAFADIARKIGVEVAIPVQESVVDSIMSHLKGKSVTGLHTVNDGSLELIELNIQKESEVTGKSLIEIAEKGKFLILMVLKNGMSSYSIPTGSTVLSEGDKVVLMLNTQYSQGVLGKFGDNV